MRTLMWAAAACTNSGLGLPTDTDSDTDAAPAACAWPGTWTLIDTTCGSFPQFSDWTATHTGAEMVLTDAVEGGCDVDVTVEGPSCARSESWHLADPVGTDVVATFHGITTCTPDACVFDGEAPCEVGGLAGAVTATIDASTGDLVAGGLLVDTAPDCPLEFGTTWTLSALR